MSSTTKEMSSTTKEMSSTTKYQFIIYNKDLEINTPFCCNETIFKDFVEYLNDKWKNNTIEEDEINMYELLDIDFADNMKNKLIGEYVFFIISLEKVEHIIKEYGLIKLFNNKFIKNHLDLSNNYVLRHLLFGILINKIYTNVEKINKQNYNIINISTYNKFMYNENIK